MLVKNKFLAENPLNNLLFWGQGEDVEWSIRVRQKAKLLKQFNLVFKYLKFKNDDPAMDINWNKNLNILLEQTKSPCIKPWLGALKYTQNKSPLSNLVRLGQPQAWVATTDNPEQFIVKKLFRVSTL